MKLGRMCKVNYTSVAQRPNRNSGLYTLVYTVHNESNCGIFLLTTMSNVRLYGIITFTCMPTDPEAKRRALQASGTFNPRAAQVQHPLFQQSSFFDPEDLLQLKYETLRALEVESYPIAKAARDFGLSRPTIYEAQNQFQEQGLEGLLPHKRGPKAAHKLTEEVLQYVKDQVASESDIKAEELARRVRQRFGVKLHPRTIQKALNGRAKRGRST
jgi:transposase